MTDQTAQHPATPEKAAWKDRHGDIWTEGVDGRLHTPETRPFDREHVEKKWGPLTPVAYPSYYTTPAAPETDVSALREAIAKAVGRELGCVRKGLLDGHQMCGEHHYGWLSTGECPTQERVTDAVLSATRERLRVVEGEREAANVHAIECERIGVEAIEARLMETHRAESAEAALDALWAEIEALDRSGRMSFDHSDLRALLPGDGR